VRLRGRRWFPLVEVVRGDVTISSTLDAALEGVHTAYYLVHNMTHGHGYTELELESARLFAAAAARAGVEHIIYLSGLADPEQHIAPHMRSRIETGRILREGQVPVTEFRAGVIAGSGSISFEMIRFMTELFPVVPGPIWMRNKTQPIAMQNVIDYLSAALTNPGGRGGVFEIGGPDVTTYGDLMLRYARIRGLRRRMVLIPGIPLWFMAFGVSLMTPVPYPIAYALIGGLSADSVVKHPEALHVFPEVKRIGFDAATRDALEKTQPAHIERVWDAGRRAPTSMKHEGCFIDYRELTIHDGAENAFRALTALGEKRKWVMNMDQSNGHLVACIQNSVAGGKWIEWRVVPIESGAHIAQTVFFCPHGLPGFLYWFLLYPIHWLRSTGLLKRIARESNAG
jgi:uncharacterized protein YbjT (DUF2867 family)